MQSNFEVNIQHIQDAAKRIEPFVHKTPVMTSGTLDRMAGRAIHFKCEIFQKIGAFKVKLMSSYLKLFSKDIEISSKE